MKNIVAGVLTVAFVFGFTSFASAQTSVQEDLQAQVQKLMAQVKDLQARLAVVQQENMQMAKVLKMNRTLDLGAEGDDVKTLQEVLASDPEIYPEAKVTGFFGPLTEKAVMKFQSKFGLSQVGRVGPLTLERINHILENGAGKSGVVPPGLLKNFKEGFVSEPQYHGAKIKCEMKNKTTATSALTVSDCDVKAKVNTGKRDKIKENEAEEEDVEVEEN